MQKAFYKNILRNKSYSSISINSVFEKKKRISLKKNKTVSLNLSKKMEHFETLKCVFHKDVASIITNMTMEMHFNDWKINMMKVNKYYHEHFKTSYGSGLKFVNLMWHNCFISSGASFYYGFFNHRLMKNVFDYHNNNHLEPRGHPSIILSAHLCFIFQPMKQKKITQIHLPKNYVYSKQINSRIKN